MIIFQTVHLMFSRLNSIDSSFGVTQTLSNSKNTIIYILFFLTKKKITKINFNLSANELGNYDQNRTWTFIYQIFTSK